jgi:hypothetical protein
MTDALWNFVLVLVIGVILSVGALAGIAYIVADILDKRRKP